MKIGHVGAGIWGSRHCSVLAKLPNVDFVGVYDIDAERSKYAADQYGCTPAANLADLISISEAITIATPATSHFKVAQQAVRAGLHVFVEKPLCATVTQAQTLVGLTKKHNVVLQVGHIERFNLAFMVLTERSPTPICVEVRRTSTLSSRGIDVSVVFDLMVHDIDLVLDLIRSDVVRITATGLSGATGKADLANATLTFKNGAVVHLLASRLSAETQRKMTIWEAEQSYNIDFKKGSLSSYVYGCDNNQKQSIRTRHPKAFDALTRELNAFVDAITANKKPVVAIASAIRTLAIAEEIDRQIEEKSGNGAALLQPDFEIGNALSKNT